jgi:hypothetical protein
MNLEKLIANISNKGAKKALPSPLKTIIFAAIFLTIYLVILLQFFGLRGDLAIALKSFAFQAELFLNITLIIAAISAVVYLRLPRLDNFSKPIYLILILFILFSASLCFSCCDVEAHEICGGEGFHCFVGIILFSLLPMLFLMAILRRGILTNYLASSLAIGLASGSFAYLVERLANATEDRLHLIIWHFSPIFLVVLISSFCLKKLIKKL